jgi:cellobiose-specific phosphotransferase system component IIC
MIPSMRHRPFHTSAIPKPPLLYKQFLAFVHPSTVSSSFQSVIGCLYVVVESLGLYFVVKSAMTSNWRDEFCSTTFLEGFNAPIYWLLEHKLPAYFAHREEILSKMTHVLVKKAPAIAAAIYPTISDTKLSMFEVLSSQYVSAFQTVLTDEIYNVHFVMPLVFFFGAHGVSRCRDVCEGILKKYVEVA